MSSTFGEFPFLPIPNFPPVATRAFAGRRRLRIGRLFLARSHPFTTNGGLAIGQGYFPSRVTMLELRS